MNNCDIMKEPIMYIVVTEITRYDGSKCISSHPIGFNNELFDGFNEKGGLEELDTTLNEKVIAVIPAPPRMFKVYKVNTVTNMLKLELIGYEHPNADNPDWTTFEEN